MTQQSLPHWTDQAHLRDVQYKDSSKLGVRVDFHRRFSTNSQGLHRWYFDRLSLPESARILELGAGTGALWLANADRIPTGWDLTLTDVSPGMLADAERNLASIERPFTFTVVDILDIPFPDNSFDAVFANNMLYHVPNLERALSEIRRVLKPGGRFVASTNGAGHLRELRALIHEVQESVAPDREEHFSLEDGEERLAPYFEHVTLARYPDSFHVTDADALNAFIGSMQDHYQLDDQQRTQVGRLIEEHIDRHGAFDITKASGMFQAW